jgi:hypothetical protein
MFLQRQDIEKISEILKEFPDINTFELNEEKSSGIGSILTMTFEQKVHSHTGTFSIEISGVENW